MPIGNLESWDTERVVELKKDLQVDLGNGELGIWNVKTRQHNLVRKAVGGFLWIAVGAEDEENEKYLEMEVNLKRDESVHLLYRVR